MKTLAVTLICKNEQSNLARLLPMLTFADQIVVVDTGSTDNTVQVARQFGNDVYFFEWCDNFAKARNYAISKAKCNYVMWLDADDVIPEQTRLFVSEWKSGSDDADFYYAKYTVANGVWFWRERIVRNCKQCRFRGFIHEAITPFGKCAYLDCEIVHKPAETHLSRNLQIYRNAILNNRRFTLRDKYYYARTLAECNMWEQAAPYLHAVAANAKANPSDRVQSCKLLARYYLSQSNYPRALKCLARATEILPPDSETCCLFGEAYYARKMYSLAAQWYLLALYAASQAAMVSDYYSFLLPHVQLSVCYWQMGDISSARKHHAAAKQRYPHNALITANDKWLG